MFSLRRAVGSAARAGSARLHNSRASAAAPTVRCMSTSQDGDKSVVLLYRCAGCVVWPSLWGGGDAVDVSNLTPCSLHVGVVPVWSARAPVAAWTRRASCAGSWTRGSPSTPSLRTWARRRTLTRLAPRPPQYVHACSSSSPPAHRIGVHAGGARSGQIGAASVHVADLKEDFLMNYIVPSIQCNALYENLYLLGTSLARPCISKGAVRWRVL